MASQATALLGDASPLPGRGARRRGGSTARRRCFFRERLLNGLKIVGRIGVHRALPMPNDHAAAIDKKGFRNAERAKALAEAIVRIASNRETEPHAAHIVFGFLIGFALVDVDSDYRQNCRTHGMRAHISGKRRETPTALVWFHFSL